MPANKKCVRKFANTIFCCNFAARSLSFSKKHIFKNFMCVVEPVTRNTGSSLQLLPNTLK